MIPYDDLVTALSAWRARQGLPVNTMGGSGSGPTAKAGSGPNQAPHAVEAAEEVLEEAAYEHDGDEGYPEPTAIGEAPERPTEAELGDDRNDW
jgi:hypothetical protein